MGTKMWSSWTKTLLIICLAAANTQAQHNEASERLFNKGQQMFMQGKPKEAVKFLDQAIAADSTNYNAWIRRGFIRGTLNDFDGEMSDYTTVIQKDPAHVWAYISRGSALNRLNKFAEAKLDFEKAIELDASIPESYNNYGFAYKGEGNMEKACSCWEKSKRLGNDEAKIILKNNHCK